MQNILKYFQVQKSVLKLFQDIMVDRPVDRNYFRPKRSTGPFGHGRARRACLSVDRQPLRSTDRLTDYMTLALGLCRSTGPVDQQFKNFFLKMTYGRPGDRPEPMVICQVVCWSTGQSTSRRPGWLNGSILDLFCFFMGSNGYFLFSSG